MQDFDDILERVRGTPRCAVPAALCDGSLGALEASGVAQKVVMSALWLSSRYVREGRRVRVFCPMAEIATLVGVDRQRRLGPVREAVAAAANARLDSAGRDIAVFRMLEEADLHGVAGAHWIVSDAFAEIFADPTSFGVIDMREMRGLRSGLDMLIYRRVVRVRNMRTAQTALDRDEVAQALGGIDRTGRASEKVRRAAGRVASCLGDRVDVASRRVAGGRRLAGWTLSVARDAAAHDPGMCADTKRASPEAGPFKAA